MPGTGRHDEPGEMARDVLVFRDDMMRENELAATHEAEHQSTEQAQRRAALIGMADTVEPETAPALQSIGARANAVASTAVALSDSAALTGDSARDAASGAAQALRYAARSATWIGGKRRAVPSTSQRGSAPAGPSMWGGAPTCPRVARCCVGFLPCRSACRAGCIWTALPPPWDATCAGRTRTARASRARWTLQAGRCCNHCCDRPRRLRRRNRLRCQRRWGRRTGAAPRKSTVPAATPRKATVLATMTARTWCPLCLYKTD